MNTHTPGPWRVVIGEQSICTKLVSVVDANDDTVCDNETYYPAALNPLNANLIAAAPDLLEALEKIKYKMEQGLKPYHASEFYGDIVTAIAKAKGEKS